VARLSAGAVTDGWTRGETHTQQNAIRHLWLTWQPYHRRGLAGRPGTLHWRCDVGYLRTSTSSRSVTTISQLSLSCHQFIRLSDWQMSRALNTSQHARSHGMSALIFADRMLQCFKMYERTARFSVAPFQRARPVCTMRSSTLSLVRSRQNFNSLSFSPSQQPQ